MTRPFRSTHARSMAAVAALAAGCTMSDRTVRDELVTLPAAPVDSFRSDAGESLDSFLVRVGAALFDFSARTQLEACGTVAESADGQRFAVDAYTYQSHVFCLSLAENVAPGFVTTGQAIHSHPTKRAFHATDADRAFLGIRPSASPVTIRIQRPEWFSAGDYDNGPGYLATARGVYFQAGRGGERLIGSFPITTSAGGGSQP